MKDEHLTEEDVLLLEQKAAEAYLLGDAEEEAWLHLEVVQLRRDGV